MTEINIKIDWDTEVDGEILSSESLKLPTEKIITVDIPKDICETILDTMDVDDIIDQLSDKYGYCVSGFIATAHAI